MDKTEQNLPSEIRNWIGRQLFEHVPNNIAVIDRNLRVVTSNGNFRSVFGDPTGKYCYEVYKARDKACKHCMAARTFIDGKVRINDEEGIDKDGRPAHYVVHIAPVFDEAGHVAYVIEMSYDLTETKSLQREYNILFERVPCYVSVINRDLRVVRSNRLLRQTFGDRSGEHCYEVLKQQGEPCPDCPALETFRDGGSHRSEQVGVDKNGNPTHFIVSTSPLARSGEEFAHIIEMAVDVTDVHKLNAALLKESSFRHILIENTLDALVATDDNETINIFNKAAEELFKISAKQVIGKMSGEKFFPKPFTGALHNGRTQVSLPETNVTDIEGAEIPVRFSGSVLRDGEKVIGAAGFFQDLQELKTLEREKLENERLAAVGQTVAQLAHGIKNILTGLRGGMYAIKSGVQSGSEQRMNKGWDMLDRNVERMTVLVKGFLSYSKKYVPKVELVDPVEIAREVISLYEAGAKKQGIELRLEAKTGIARSNLDPSGLHTCLANLVSNALDACKMSDETVRRVVMRVVEEDGVLIFEVEDNGVGMEPEVKERVFKNFFTTKGLSGTGLGLLVTRKTVNEHGGRILLQSEPGKGSLFRIEFPRKRLPRGDV